MMRESELLNDIIRALYPWIRLNRANVGSVRTADGRWFSTGLPKGFPDLFGTLPASVTGRDAAVPVFIEAKKPGGRVSEEQEKFLASERGKGSVAGVCYSVEEAYRMIEPYIREDLRRVEDGEKEGTMDSGGATSGRGSDAD